MKVLVLQWCLDIKDGYPTSRECGTIERISTTARDCVDALIAYEEILSLTALLSINSNIEWYYSCLLYNFILIGYDVQETSYQSSQRLLCGRSHTLAWSYTRKQPTSRI